MAKYKEPVLIVGLGRFGLALARELTLLEVPVLAVDSSIDAVQHASFTVPNAIAANCTDIDALRQIGAADFTRAVVGIGSNMEASILATSLLVDLGIADVWAKASTTQHARILQRIGAHHVVQPEHDMGERVAHLVSNQVLDYLEVDPGWVMARTHPPKDLVGQPLGGTQMRSRRGVTVVAVKRADSDAYTHCDASTVLSYGDDILVMGTPRDIERFVDS